LTISRRILQTSNVKRPAPQIQLWCWHCAPYKCSYIIIIIIIIIIIAYLEDDLPTSADCIWFARLHQRVIRSLADVNTLSWKYSHPCMFCSEQQNMQTEKNCFFANPKYTNISNVILTSVYNNGQEIVALRNEF